LLFATGSCEGGALRNQKIASFRDLGCAGERDSESVYGPEVVSAAMRILAEWLLEQSERTPEAVCPSARYLTVREREVVGLIGLGMTNCEIARELVIAPSTAERHVANILKKLGLRSRSEIAAWAIRWQMEPFRGGFLHTVGGPSN
jgi:DNA-binding NarL/FixJ family response regulator